MTPAHLLAHATRFSFLLKPNVELIVAQTAKGYIAWRDFPSEGAGYIVPTEATHGRYLNRDGSYGWPGQNGAKDEDFRFDKVEDVLIAAGDTFVTLTEEQVSQLQKDSQLCQT